MASTIGRYWVLLPILASVATECGESPRGTTPSVVVPIELVLTSVPAPPPADVQKFENCLNRMHQVNNVEPSWRAGEIVPLTETEPWLFTALFPFVPVDFQNTMAVHDVNECRRDPEGSGHVTMGVTVNGTPITHVIGNNVLAFTIRPDGTVE